MIHQTLDLQVNYSKLNIIDNNYHATLTTFFMENDACIDENRKRPVILICPGGAYMKRSFRENEAVALRFNALGYHAAVLNYSVAPTRFPAAVCEAATAVAMLRENALKWHIDTDKIVICGFSAGGHVACSLGVYSESSWLNNLLNTQSFQIKPNAMLLSYPVITSGVYAHAGSFENLLGEQATDLEKRELVSLEKQVTPITPPTFLWHTVADETVPVENSLLFATALQANHVPFELHMFTKGIHGLGLATEETKNSEGRGVQPECACWPDLFSVWLNSNL
ncbi:MAG: alpha/beta hydrolase [Oscillospiraceae bacterium]|nr:alpha/beta hydrolase [Oscillospiraceae bacterium]